MRPNPLAQYVQTDGRLTILGIQLLGDLERRLVDVEARFAAIAAVAAPTGGTSDAEARAAINAIIAGAA